MSNVIAHQPAHHQRVPTGDEHLSFNLPDRVSIGRNLGRAAPAAGRDGLSVHSVECGHFGNDFELDSVAGGDARGHRQDGSNVCITDIDRWAGLSAAGGHFKDGKCLADVQNSRLIVQGDGPWRGKQFSLVIFVKPGKNAPHAVGVQKGCFGIEAAGRVSQEPGLVQGIVGTVGYLFYPSAKC